MVIHRSLKLATFSDQQVVDCYADVIKIAKFFLDDIQGTVRKVCVDSETVSCDCESNALIRNVKVCRIGYLKPVLNFQHKCHVFEVEGYWGNPTEYVIAQQS